MEKRHTVASFFSDLKQVLGKEKVMHILDMGKNGAELETVLHINS